VNNNQSSISKLAGQTLVYGLGTILPRLLNFAILTFFYTRVLDMDAYGTVTEIYAYVVLVMVIITFGMETGFFRFASQGGDMKKVYTHAFIFVSAMAMAWILLVQIFIDPVSKAIQYDNHPEYIRWFSYIIALDAIAAIPFAKLRQQERAKRFALLKLGMVLVNVVVVVLFLWIFPLISKSHPGFFPRWFYNPDIGVGYVFIVNLLTSLLAFLLLIPELKDLRIVFDPKLMLRMLSFSAPLVVVGLAGAINDVADKILLKFFIADTSKALETVGLYGGNYRLAVIMTLFIQMFRYAFEPFLFSISKNSDAKQTYARVMKYFVISGLLIFLGVSLYMDGLKYFLDKSYHEGNGIVPVILMANLLLGIYYSLSVWYKVTDKTIYAAVIAGAGAIFTLVFNILLIPVWGYWASAWATLGCYLMMVTISWIWGRRVYPVPYQTSQILAWIALALTLFALSEIFRPEHIIIRLVYNTVLMLVFILLVAVKEKDLVNLLLVRIGLRRKS